MDDKEQELLSACADLREKLGEAVLALRDYRISRCPHAIGDVLLVGPEKSECRVVDHDVYCGNVYPVLIKRKKNGEWGAKTIPVWQLTNMQIVPAVPA